MHAPKKGQGRSGNSHIFEEEKGVVFKRWVLLEENEERPVEGLTT